MLIVNKLVSKC